LHSFVGELGRRQIALWFTRVQELEFASESEVLCKMLRKVEGYIELLSPPERRDIPPVRRETKRA